MDPDKRRLHVNRIAANFDHLPTTEQDESEVKLQSFTYIPEQTTPEPEVDEFYVPRGTPSLFEEAPMEFGESERVAQPSPLSPHEVGHAPLAPEVPTDKSLEEKFIQAINEPGSVELDTQNDSLPVASHEALTESAPLVSENAATTIEGASDHATPHGEHFAEAAPPAVIESQGEDDAGLGASIMEKRVLLKKQQEQEAG